jgi:lactate permease
MPDSTAFDVIAAAAPPLVVLILMVGFRWGGSKAGAAGWLAALILALLRFRMDAEITAYAHLRGLVLTVDVVYIVFAALLLYIVVDQAGAMRVIAGWFIDLTGDDVLRVLLLGWVFTSFLQGVGGFGVPVAIVAPLLVGLGLKPLPAVVIPSIGHAWAVTFGSLGSSFTALVGVTGMADSVLAPPAAFLLGVAAVACGLLVAHAYAGTRGVRHALPAVLFIGLVMAVVQFVIASTDLWNVGSASAGMAGIAAGLWVTRWPMYRKQPQTDPTGEPKIPRTPTPGAPTFAVAISGYVVLIVLAFVIKGIGPIDDFLGKAYVRVTVPQLETSRGFIAEPATSGIRVFTHTGSILLYSAVVAYAIFVVRGHLKQDAIKGILRSVYKKGYKTAIGILFMMAMAMIMAGSGMTQTLAEWLSDSVPADLYAFVATIIGALGAFMTGSNTNSNAVFGQLQMETALLLSLDAALVLGIQTAAAAIASLLAPAKIMVGASTVGMAGDEGNVLRSLLLYGGALLLLIAVMGFGLLLVNG